MSISLTIVDDSLPDHLGGHENETHIDKGALQYLIDTFSITSMVDVGCGPGGMVKTAKEMGLKVLGVDGDFSVEREGLQKFVDYVIHDYSKEPFALEEYIQTPLGGFWDLAWSVEFLEHVDAEYIYNFMETFRACKYVVCTHALPGQPGHHHVNCREAPYWVDIFKAFGFEIDVEATNAIREASTMAERYMRQQSLFFRNMRT